MTAVDPARCATFRRPAAGTTDRELVDEFAFFLSELARRGEDQLRADPEWAPYFATSGPAPGCAGCRDVGPHLVAPLASGQPWTCQSCGTVWSPPAPVGERT